MLLMLQSVRRRVPAASYPMLPCNVECLTPLAWLVRGTAGLSWGARYRSGHASDLSGTLKRVDGACGGRFINMLRLPHRTGRAAGAHDVQDGPASNEAWMAALEWDGAAQFAAAKRRIIRAKDVGSGEGSRARGGGWGGSESGISGPRLNLPHRVGSSTSGTSGGAAAATTTGRAMQQRRLLQQPGSSGQSTDAAAAADPHSGSRHKRAGNPVVAFWKQGGGLTHVVLTEAGHMAPRDAPKATQWMFERWAAVIAGAAASA